MTNKKRSETSLLVDRIYDAALPNAAATIQQHDIDIPEGYIAEIYGAEVWINGSLDTGGTIGLFLSLDEDVITELVAKEADDVICAFQFETLLVTTGGAMMKTCDRVFFPSPIPTAHSILQWIVGTATDWSAANGSYAIYYKLRKATKEDIVELLLRRR